MLSRVQARFLIRPRGSFKWILRSLLGAGLMLAAVAGAAAEHIWHMDLRWNFLKLGQVKFIAATTDSEERLEIIGKTAGPLRWVKNYDGRGLLERQGKHETYTLEGTDGGVREIRRIVFERGELPRVLEFKDSAAESYLVPEEPWGRQAWAPMALVDRVLKSAERPELCVGEFTVFDGKRRYQVLLSGTHPPKVYGSVKPPLPRLSQCSSVLLGESMHEVGHSPPQSAEDTGQEGATMETSKMRQVWLFGRGDRRIDFVFGGECGAGVLTEIRFHSPLGMILGRLTGPCPT